MFKTKEIIIKTVGLIILLLLVCFLSYKIVYKIMHRTDMKLIVQYDTVPAINKDVHFFRIDVHYRGYDVGDVTNVKLSEDQKHIEFYVDIHYKGLKIPSNSSIAFKTENIYGQRYLDIEYPKNPSKRLFKNGDTVDGKEVYERIDEYLVEELSSDENKKMVQNLYDIINILKKSLTDIDNCKLLNRSSGDLAVILGNLRDITEDKSFRKDIKATAKHSCSSLKCVDEILNNKEMQKTISQAPATVNQTMQDMTQMTQNMGRVGDILPHVNKNLDCVNTLLTDANCNLCTINTKVPPIPQSLVENAETLVVKTNCFETELSKILSKRFLLLRLIFGNPGKSFNKCSKVKCKCSK